MPSAGLSLPGQAIVSRQGLTHGFNSKWITQRIGISQGAVVPVSIHEDAREMPVGIRLGLFITRLDGKP